MKKTGSTNIHLNSLIQKLKTVSIKEDVTPYAPTKLASVDEVNEVDGEAKRDGVTRRIKIPSWDDIMFGKKDED